jgi:two-component system sensor histidine kinase AtoS
VSTDPAPEDTSTGLPDLGAALRLFDETTRALEARARRLEEVLTVKQQELEAANSELAVRYSELDRLHAWLELILSAVPSGVVAVDRDGRVTTCNRAAREALTVELPEPDGADYRAACPESPLWQVLAEGVTKGPYERRISAGPDQRERVLAGHASPVCASDGAILGAVEVFEDVTELRGLEQQLERVERLKALGEMAAGVAHEIRNPLNGVEGFASLLARDLEDGSTQRRYADAIIDGVRHLNRTVTGLLEFTRPREPQRRPVPPDELVESCVELVRAEDVALASPREGEADEQARARIEFVSRWDRGRIAIDGGQIRQVLLNLIQNAVQICSEYRDTQGQVAVAVSAISDEQLGACCQVTVDDNGPGVSEDQRPNIFLPFHTTRERGTGLGLAVAHTLVQLHGGSLSVDTAPELGGARFTMLLPIEATGG